jgi:hydrogenase maturation protease
VKTLVLGMGNTILGDDGVGIHIVRKLAQRSHPGNTDFKETGAGGLSLLELIRGYDRLIIADAVMTREAKPGKIKRIMVEEIKETSGAITPHDAGFAATIQIGTALFPDEMPRKIIIYAINTEDAEQVTEEMSAKVRKAVPYAVKRIASEINNTYRSVKS